MQGNPMDMVDEMNGMFARLFSRMDREFIDGSSHFSGYRIMIRDNSDSLGGLEVADEASCQSRITGKPVAEVHHIGNEVKVITELPGITEDKLRLDVKENTLVIDAGDADHSYRTSATLPLIDTGSMRKTLKNGVLEVTFTNLPAPSGKA
jgi:HSP20 family molecular chaperone IbpA